MVLWRSTVREGGEREKGIHEQGSQHDGFIQLIILYYQRGRGVLIITLQGVAGNRTESWKPSLPAAILSLSFFTPRKASLLSGSSWLSADTLVGLTVIVPWSQPSSQLGGKQAWVSCFLHMLPPAGLGQQTNLGNECGGPSCNHNTWKTKGRRSLSLALATHYPGLNETLKWASKQSGRQAGRWVGGWTGRQAGKQTHFKSFESEMRIHEDQSREPPLLNRYTIESIREQKPLFPHSILLVPPLLPRHSWSWKNGCIS